MFSLLQICLQKLNKIHHFAIPRNCYCLPIAECTADIYIERFLGTTVNLLQILAVKSHRILQSSSVSLRQAMVSCKLKKEILECEGTP